MTVHFKSSGGTELPWNGYANSDRVLRCDSVTLEAIYSENGRVLKRFGDPLRALEWMSATFNEAGRWMGFLSYDLGRSFEKLPTLARDPLQLPLFAFVWQSGETSAAYRASREMLQARAESNFTRLAYEQAVQKAIRYIAAGDVFQINLSQRFEIETNIHAWELFERLYSQSPGLYSAMLQFEDFALVSHSPELFLQVTPDRRVITRPIKGTRPRSKGMDRELMDSVKDAAELNMIIDLERNDLGRVCEIGSVRVSQPRTIEAHPTVFHGVATVEGKLRDNVKFVDLLRATFPGGSITGAPKIRAMEIIEELEPVRRGPYCGAIGYLAADGSMEFNVAIRTVILKNGKAYVSVGGGIVADSDPASEYEETLVKARGMFAALGVQAI